MSMQCMQVIIMVFGSRDAKYFSYDGPDGFKAMRYVSSNHVCGITKPIGLYNSGSLDIQLPDSLHHT